MHQVNFKPITVTQFNPTPLYAIESWRDLRICWIEVGNTLWIPQQVNINSLIKISLARVLLRSADLLCLGFKFLAVVAWMWTSNGKAHLSLCPKKNNWRAFSENEFRRDNWMSFTTQKRICLGWTLSKAILGDSGIPSAVAPSQVLQHTESDPTFNRCGAVRDAPSTWVARRQMAPASILDGRWLFSWFFIWDRRNWKPPCPACLETKKKSKCNRNIRTNVWYGNWKVYKTGLDWSFDARWLKDVVVDLGCLYRPRFQVRYFQNSFSFIHFILQLLRLWFYTWEPHIYPSYNRCKWSGCGCE